MSATIAARPLVRLWKDASRSEQLQRIAKLHRQECDKAARSAWADARERLDAVPQGARVDLPSVHVFSAVLGLYCSAASLKNRAMNELELSAKEIAAVVGYSKATVEAALRWLGCDSIEVRGVVVANGLGLIRRKRRTGRAFVKGIMQRIYRTSCTMLTNAGRALLKLAAVMEKTRARVADVPPEPAFDPLFPKGADFFNMLRQRRQM